jgi:hypothetical protein
MLPRSPLFALSAFALLAGCSGAGGSNQPPPVTAEAPPPLPQAPAPTPMNDAPAGLDGHYVGTLHLARAAWPNCQPASIPASATIANGQLAMNLGRYGDGQGIIGGDGGANLIGNGSNFVGDMRIRGKRLGGLVQHTTCPYTADLKKLVERR